MSSGPRIYRVKLEGVGFWIELWVDTLAVHVTGDAPMLSRLLAVHWGRG